MPENQRAFACIPAILALFVSKWLSEDLIAIKNANSNVFIDPGLPALLGRLLRPGPGQAKPRFAAWEGRQRTILAEDQKRTAGGGNALRLAFRR